MLSIVCIYMCKAAEMSDIDWHPVLIRVTFYLSERGRGRGRRGRRRGRGQKRRWEWSLYVWLTRLEPCSVFYRRVDEKEGSNMEPTCHVCSTAAVVVSAPAPDADTFNESRLHAVINIHFRNNIGSVCLDVRILNHHYE